MKEKDYAKAVQLCDQLLAKDATHTGALLTKARALDAQGELPAAIKTYRDYLAIKPNDIAANAAMIIAMAEAKQCAEATAEAVAAAERFSSMGSKEMGKINFAWGKALFCARGLRRRQGEVQRGRRQRRREVGGGGPRRCGRL